MNSKIIYLSIFWVFLSGFVYKNLNDYKVLKTTQKVIEGNLLTYPQSERGYTRLKIKGEYIGFYSNDTFLLGEYIVATKQNPDDRNYKVEKIENKNIMFLNTFAILRQSVIELVEQNLSEPYAALVLGLTLGVSPQFPAEFEQLFKNSGLIHILVVSGYNISLVTGMLTPIILRVSKTFLIPISTATALIYILFVGFEPPVMRALLMFILALIAYTSGRLTFPLYTLIFTTFLYLLLFPYLGFDLSFYLTTAATFGIFSGLLIMERLKVLVEIDLVMEQIFILVSINIFVAPILLLYFGSYSFGGILSNLIITDIVPLATVLSFAYLGTVILKLKILTTTIGILIYICFEFVLTIASVLGSSDFLTLNASFPGKSIAIIYALVIMIYIIVFKSLKLNN